MTEHKNQQENLEQEMIELGRQRYLHKVKRAAETKLESTTSVGQRLLAHSITEMAQALTDWLKKAKKAPGKRHRAYEFLSILPPEVCAGITAKSVLDSISVERKIMSAASVVGRMIEDEIRFRELQSDHPSLWQQMHRVLDRYQSYTNKSKFINRSMQYHQIIMPKWSRKEAASVGLTCIELLRQSTAIIDIMTRTNQAGKSYTIIKPTSELLTWIKKSHEYNEYLNPVWLPMVQKPVEWNNVFIGGYRGMERHRRPLVKLYDESHMETLSRSKMPSVYSAVNSLQSTAYKVNGRMVDVLKHCRNRGLPIGGLPPMEDTPIPPKPANIGEDEEARRQWRKSAARTHFDNERIKSKRLQVLKVLNLSNKFLNQKIFFPLSLDFRSRVYPRPYFLQPQGPDWSRSLLWFNRGVPVNECKDESGVKWLLINAANKWGMSKSNYDERIKWVEDNISLIRNIGRDPLSDMTWAKADEPWGFLAACMEINDFHNTGSSFNSTLPIGMDATTQGLQLYSIILRDYTSAVATNVIPNESPNDVYQQVADIVRKKLYEKGDDIGKKWLEFGISRSTTKRSTMTLCYGSTYYSCKEYVTEWFYDLVKSGKENPFGDSTYQPCSYLATIVWESIGEVVGSARRCMDWLREVAGICVDNGVPVRWITPLGFPVSMHYESTDRYAVKTLVNGVMRQHRLRMPNGRPNRRKTVNSVCPNWIHSLDGLGGLLGESVVMCTNRGIKDITSTHDTMSTHSAYCSLMASCIREATISIFEYDVLADFATQIECTLPSGVSLPSLPEMGTLDLTRVRDSLYYWN